MVNDNRFTIFEKQIGLADFILELFHWSEGVSVNTKLFQKPHRTYGMIREKVCFVSLTLLRSQMKPKIATVCYVESKANLQIIIQFLESIAKWYQAFLESLFLVNWFDI